jgi:exosortase
MVDQWTHDEDMGHGFVVPSVCVYIAWRERGRWLDEVPRPTWWGFLPVVLGGALMYLARIGAGLFLASVALWFALAGVLLVLGGAPWLRGLAFPLLLLLFALPKLAIIYNQVTLPLQLLASRMAVAILSGVGIHVVRQGNILTLDTMQLFVAEACNGIRYLLSLSFLAVAFAYFVDPKRWMRLVLALATVPISIFANAFRVALVGWVGHFKPALATGVLHGASGWVLFAGCCLLLVALRSLINRLLGQHA